VTLLIVIYFSKHHHHQGNYDLHEPSEERKNETDLLHTGVNHNDNGSDGISDKNERGGGYKGRMNLKSGSVVSLRI
jgi:hypothetical protein